MANSTARRFAVKPGTLDSTVKAVPHYWFPAKRYGWGWGPPCTWQGWLVLAAFVAMLSVGAALLPPRAYPMEFVAYVIALSVGLLVVCYAKGEPPAWHWGDR